jgi:hypothetical protein
MRRLPQRFDASHIYNTRQVDGCERENYTNDIEQTASTHTHTHTRIRIREIAPFDGESNNCRQQCIRLTDIPLWIGDLARS